MVALKGSSTKTYLWFALIVVAMDTPRKLIHQFAQSPGAKEKGETSEINSVIPAVVGERDYGP